MSFISVVKIRASSGFTNVTGNFLESRAISSARKWVRCRQTKRRARRKGEARRAGQDAKSRSHFSAAPEKGPLPLQEKRLRIGHEKEIMNQGNDGYAHQQHGGTRQELPEIIHRGVGEITDGHPREHESLFGEILFAPREKKGHQEGENTHKQKKLHNLREQRIQET